MTDKELLELAKSVLGHETHLSEEQEKQFNKIIANADNNPSEPDIGSVVRLENGDVLKRHNDGCWYETKFPYDIQWLTIRSSNYQILWTPE